MRVIFMGTPDFSVPVLEALVAAGHEIAAVYCQPPRPATGGDRSVIRAHNNTGYIDFGGGQYLYGAI